MDRTELAGAVSAFLNAGGEVVQLDGFTGTAPIRPRREIPRSTKPLKRPRSRPKSHRMSAEDEMALVSQIRAFAAEGSTQKAAREAIGISQMMFVCLCFEHQIKFPKNNQDHRQAANEKTSLKAKAKRDELAPKVAEYAHLGTRACGELLGISAGNVSRIARENGIPLKRHQ